MHVVGGIHVSGLITLGDLIVGIGTLALAVFTWRLAGQTRNLATETAEDVRAEWRPVVCESKLMTVAADRGQPLGSLDVWLVNVGRGPALNVSATMASWSSVPDTQTGSATIGTLLPNEEHRQGFPNVLIRDASGGSEPELSYLITVTYEDLSGRPHETELHYSDPASGSRPAQTQSINFAPTLMRTVFTVAKPSRTRWR